MGKYFVEAKRLADNAMLRGFLDPARAESLKDAFGAIEKVRNADLARYAKSR